LRQQQLPRHQLPTLHTDVHGRHQERLRERRRLRRNLHRLREREEMQRRLGLPVWRLRERHLSIDVFAFSGALGPQPTRGWARAGSPPVRTVPAERHLDLGRTLTVTWAVAVTSPSLIV